MGRVACIDIGTNSVLLLVAERQAGGEVALLERATITRLGEGVDATGELSPAARERTLRCLAGYADEARALGVDRILAVGTSAMRDARGGAAFAAEAASLLGEAPRVISGEEEARLTFAGSLSGLAAGPGPVAVFDVGGGSTEIILGEAEPRVSIQRSVSLDVGSVRLTERYLRADPPSAGEVAAVRAEVDRQLASFEPLPGGVRLVGVAGTVTTLAAVALGVVPYDGARVHGARLSSGQVTALAERLSSMTLAERKALPGLEPKRADVIAAGALLVARVVGWVGAAELVVSDRGVRWGLAREALGAP